MGRTEDRPRSGRPRATMAASDNRIRVLNFLDWSEGHGMGWHVGYSSNWPPVNGRHPLRRSLSWRNSDEIQTLFVRRQRMTFQQDNACPHVARVFTQFPQAQNIHAFPPWCHPSNTCGTFCLDRSGDVSNSAPATPGIDPGVDEHDKPLSHVWWRQWDADVLLCVS